MRIALVAALLLTTLTAACGATDVGSGSTAGSAGGEDAPVPTIDLTTVPEDLQAAAMLFEANCAKCHGFDANGTDQGPPFISPVYVASHHGDQSFINAATTGVIAHHWKFGNMPPVEGITEDEVWEIVKYVRYVQAEAGM